MDKVSSPAREAPASIAQAIVSSAMPIVSVTALLAGSTEHPIDWSGIRTA